MLPAFPSGGPFPSSFPPITYYPSSLRWQWGEGDLGKASFLTTSVEPSLHNMQKRFKKKKRGKKKWKFLVKASICTKSITACMNCSTMTIAVNASNDIIVFQITKCRRLVREAEEKELKAGKVLKDIRSKRCFFRLSSLLH